MTESLIQDQETQVAEAEAPEYQLRISSDRVSVLLDCPDPLANLEDLIPRLTADFKLLDIPEFPNPEQLAEILTSVGKPGEDLRDQPIMMGRAVVPMVNGYLQWTRDFFASGWKVDEVTGSIDFWSKLEDRSVHADELLVQLFDPVDGVPGLNVFGVEIPVSKPEKAKLRAGKNVRTEATDLGTDYYATCAGRVRYADGVVSVDDVFVIKGNVSLETGNIRHTGAVMIQGDVKTGATIEADGDIMVKGLMEPCHLKGGGGLVVAGGILGEEGYRIEVTGDLTARYISEANLEVLGDILVTNEIAHSHILCRGKVAVPKGRIAGGSATALKGIRVNEAGSSAATDTRLIAGQDFTANRKVHWHEEKIKLMEAAQQKVQNTIERNKDKKDLTADQIKALNVLKRKNNRLAQSMADQFTSIQKMKVESANSGKNEIIIFQELWSGTTIQLGTAKKVIRRSLLKPRLAELRRGQVKILPLGEGNMPED